MSDAAQEFGAITQYGICQQLVEWLQQQVTGVASIFHYLFHSTSFEVELEVVVKSLSSEYFHLDSRFYHV